MPNHVAVRRRLDAQLGRPHGIAGRLVLSSLNLANGALNRATVDALSLLPGERVLDVGFGGGVGVRRALKAGAQVIAIDPSPVAVAAGRRAFGDRVVVRSGDAAHPGQPPATLDAAYSVNTVYFWADPPAGLRALHTAIRPGGRLALGIEERELARHAGRRPDLPSTASALAAAAVEAGFADMQVTGRPRRRAVIAAIRNPEPPRSSPNESCGSIDLMVKRGFVGLGTLYAGVALIGHAQERRGAITCGCSERCWCKRQGLSLFRWTFPLGHTSR